MLKHENKKWRMANEIRKWAIAFFRPDGLRPLNQFLIGFVCQRRQVCRVMRHLA